MAERNFTGPMDEALTKAQFAQCMMTPLLSMIFEESGFVYSDEEAAGRASERILSLADSVINYSKMIGAALEKIEIETRSARHAPG